jgi:hypothetical protein
MFQKDGSNQVKHCSSWDCPTPKVLAEVCLDAPGVVVDEGNVGCLECHCVVCHGYHGRYVGSGIHGVFNWVVGPFFVVEGPLEAACEDGDDALEGVCFLESGEEIEREEDAGCDWKYV